MQIEAIWFIGQEKKSEPGEQTKVSDIKKARSQNKATEMGNIIKGENRYALARNEDTWHIFPATHTKDGCNLLNRNSICEGLNWNDAVEKGNCNNEQRAREKCFEIGRPICGTCLSHLYKKVSDEEQAILNS